MSTVDDGVSGDLNRIRTSVATNLAIHAGVRERALGDCVTKVASTKASKSKHLSVGPLEVDEVTDEKGDIPLGHHEVGAAYVTKAEYSKRLCFSGKQIRRAETEFAGRLSDRLNEAMDHVWDKALMDAACGQMIVGDECNLRVVNVECCIEHNDQGITPEKITQAVTLLQKMNNGNARPIIPFTAEMHRQLTSFAQFTNSDFLIEGQSSAYSNMMMREKNQKWFGATFKSVADRKMEDVTKHTCRTVPTIKAEPYVVNGVVQPNKYVRYIPVYDARAIYWEAGYDAAVDMFPIWKERGKPKGTSEMRIDAEFGMGRVDNCGVVILKVVEECKLLKV